MILERKCGTALFMVPALLIFLFGVSFAQQLDVSGTYKTNLSGALLTLDQSGNKVTGSYANSSGKLSGTLDGNVIAGTYRWNSDDDSGKFRFVFSEDGSFFNGKWCLGLSKEPYRSWNGRKLVMPSPLNPADPPMNIAGVYDTNLGGAALSLKQDGCKITGTYANNSGHLSGILKGNTVKGTFRWDAENDNGYFEFEFSGDASSFTGKWGDLTGEPTNKWNGKKQ